MSPRQRFTLRRSWLTVAGQLVAGVVGLALVWGAVAAALLLAGVDTASVRSLTGYESAHRALAGIESADVRDESVRLAVGIGGLLAALILALLARAQLPHPQLARSAVQLGDGDRGRTVVAPRAVERAVEAAALDDPAVRAARGRYGGDALALDVGLAGAGRVPDTLHSVREAARRSLERHGLPATPVHVTLTKLEATPGRDLN